MKNQMMNLLRGGVFLLAMVLAFAFTEKRDVLQPVYGTDGIAWYNATDKEEGVHYRCNLPSDEVCLRTMPDLGAQPVAPGQFENILLIPIP